MLTIAAAAAVAALLLHAPHFPSFAVPAALHSLLHYHLPLDRPLLLHSACNVGKDGDVTLFFGLSGVIFEINGQHSRSLVCHVCQLDQDFFCQPV
jgi:hypothetical protein